MASLTSTRRYGYLAAGSVLLLFAQHGRFDIAAAGWLFAPFLLAFARSTGPWRGALTIWAMSTVAGAGYVLESGLPVWSPMLVFVAVIAVVLTVPFLLDRLAHPRLAGAGAAAGLVAASLVFPLARVAAEFLVASLTPFGSVVGSLAATQHDNLPLLQLASVTGAYGVSFLLAWSGAVAAEALAAAPPWRRLRVPALALTVVLAAVLAGGTVRLALAEPVARRTVAVAGLSPPRAVHEPRDALLGDTGFERIPPAVATRLRAAFAASNDALLRDTERAARAGAKIIVWPEVGGAAFADDEARLVDQVRAIARHHGAYVQMGLGVITRTPPYARNKAVLVDPAGQVLWTYDKAHPVPGMETFRPGDGRLPTARTPYGTLSAVICFDADFPRLMRGGQDRGIGLMMIPALDWPGFGRVHAEKSRIRAVENGYAVVRQAAKGVAVAYDNRGRTLATADYYATDRQAMAVSVPLGAAPTVYGTIGDAFAWLCVTALVLLLGLTMRRSGPVDAPGRPSFAPDAPPLRIYTRQ